MKLKILTYIFTLILLVGTAQAYVLSGTVTGEGTPLQNAIVEARDTLDNPIISPDNPATTSSSGIYSMEIGTGLVIVTVTDIYGIYDSQIKSIFMDSAKTLNFNLGPIQTVTLTGKAEDVNGGLEGIEILVKRDGSTITTELTGEDGLYSVPNLENQATYDITVTDIYGIYDPQTKSITLQDPDNLELDFFLIRTSASCTDNDKDGFYIEGADCGPVDCDDNDRNVYPNAPEICDGKDNQCPGDDGYEDVDFGCDCINGQQRLCGTNLGVCQYGTQICINGQWGTCIGSIDPVEEICGDNLDNDCDGLTDEKCYPPFDYEIYVENTPAEVTLALDQGVKLNFDNIESHYATLKTLSPYYITLYIQIDPLTVSIKPNDPTEIDLDNDGKNDLVITYNGIESNQANIAFSLPEKVSTPEETTKKRKSTLPTTSIITYIKEKIPLPTGELLSFKLFKEEADQTMILATASLLFLLMLTVIVHFSKRKWGHRL